MKTETTAAIDYLVEKLGHVTNCPPIQNLTTEQKDELKNTLDSLISERLVGHWYPDKPLKGSAFRCLQITADEGYVHPLLIEGFQKIGISTTDLLRAFDKGLSIWIDPNEVSCQHGRGAIFPVYKKIGDQKVTATKSNSSNAAMNMNSIINSAWTPSEEDKKKAIRIRPNSTPPAPSSSSRMFYADQQHQASAHQMRSNTPPGLSTSEPSSRMSALNPNAKVFTFVPAVVAMVPTSMMQPPTSDTITEQKRTWGPIESEHSMYYNQQQQHSKQYQQHQHSRHHHQHQSHHQTHTNHQLPQHSSQQPSQSQWKKQQSHHSQNPQQNFHQQQSHVGWQPEEHYNKYHWTRTSH
jgi:hypothetical protein